MHFINSPSGVRLEFKTEVFYMPKIRLIDEAVLIGILVGCYSVLKQFIRLLVYLCKCFKNN